MSANQCDEVDDVLFRFEDGEMILSDHDHCADINNGLEDGVTSKKSKRKQTFERRNIKEVRDDSLNDDAKAAQLAEMERRKRLGIDYSDQTKFSNIEFLLNDTTMENCLALSSEELHESVSTAGGASDSGSSKRAKLKHANTEDDTEIVRTTVKPEYDVCMYPPSDSITKSVGSIDSSQIEDEAATQTTSASASLFGSNWSGSYSARLGHSRDDAILLGDSDEEMEKPLDSVVIEVSDGEGDLDDHEYGTEICELQDAANLADERGLVVINPNRDVNTEPEIVLPPQIARVVKPHQVSGIRFLYDNLIESLDRFETTGGFGCILAHSMGLGKTIQIIAFLDIIFRYCNAKRVLTIVPINTIQNWQAEFEIWSPPSAEKVDSAHSRSSTCTLPTEFHVSQPNGSIDEATKVAPPLEPVSSEENRLPAAANTSNGETHDGCSSLKQPECLTRAFKLFVVRDVIKTMTQRHQIIRQWHEEGGVLLLGYEMFRLLLNQKRLVTGSSLTKAEMRSASKRRNKVICVDLEREEKRQKMWADFHTALLDPGPQLVICDEGHRIKNSEASISKALKAIRTRRRVVLTGYPLQNNLMEYWCMVDFVRPNYLGTKQEFTNMFQRPIENGQCIDSTSTDRKVMQGRAHVLHDLLSGFVQRRSHAVLKATLPAKTEIVLLIKLSPLQRTLYAAFMRSLNSSGPLGWAQVNTLKTYAMCCKIWNHPDILWRAMEEHKEALDFDIDDPSSGPCGARGPRNTTTNLRLSGSQSPAIIPPLKMATGEDLHARFTKSVNGPLYANANPFLTTFPTTLDNHLGSANTQCPPEEMHTHHSQTVLPSSTASQAVAGAYDWASAPQLWGTGFKPGNVEHSGKIILFLSLLEGCVLAGDKVLVFTQSLYTLDLLERILRRLPLPNPKHADATVPSPTASIGSLNNFAVDGVPNSTVTSSDLFGFRSISRMETPCKLTAPSADVSSTVEGNRDLVSVPREETITAAVNVLFTLQEELIAGQEAQSRANDTNTFAVPAESAQEATKPEYFKKERHSNDNQERDQEETLRSLHYRLASRLGASNHPTVWTKNVHYFRLDGSTTATEREKLINHFNDPKNPAKLFLVSTRAGCLGVNLIGANRVVVFDASWNPCHDCQAVCRVYRYGQRKPCYIYRLVSDNTMEKKIYDRQVTKQGMSDRVVDELNPTQQFTRSQVELLMSFEDKDMPTLSDSDLESCKELIEPDPILASVLRKHKSWITKVPFTHESLLIDRKDYRLTRVEKRLAKQRYEQEKRLSLSYQQAHLFQFQRMQALQQQQLIAAGINPALVDQSPLFNRIPNFLSRGLSYRPTYTSGMAALDAMRQVQRETNFGTEHSRKRGSCDSSNRNPDCKVTRVVATADLYFPSTTENKTTQRLIPKGEMLEVIQTSKGKYLRIVRTGDLFVVKTSSTSSSSDASAANDQPTHSSPLRDDTNPEFTVNYSISASANNSESKTSDAPTAVPNSAHDTIDPRTSYQSELPTSIAWSNSVTPCDNYSSGVLYRGVPTSHSVTHSNWSDAINLPTVSSANSSEHLHRCPPSIPTVSASEPQQHLVSTPQPYSDLSRTAKPNLCSSTCSTSLPPCQTPPPHHFSLLHHSQLSSPSKPSSPCHDASFEQQQRRSYDDPLPQSRTAHNSGSLWSCPSCGQSSTLRCTCTIPHSSSSSVTVHSEHPTVRATTRQSASPINRSQRVSVSCFEPVCSPENATRKQGASFSSVAYYESGSSDVQFYRSADGQHQQQEQYLRAAEEVARQSAAAAAYLSFNKHQLSPAGASPHLKESPTPALPTDLGKIGASHLSAHHHSPTEPTSSNTIHNARFNVPSSQTPASVMQDYFAQLAGHHMPQPSFFPTRHAVNLAHSHSMAAAMQQYFTANMAQHPIVTSSEDMNSATFYPSLPSGHTLGGSETPQTSREPVGHHVPLTGMDHLTSHGQRNPHFISQSSQAASFDRLQSHHLLPNFRFP